MRIIYLLFIAQCPVYFKNHHFGIYNVLLPKRGVVLKLTVIFDLP